MRSTGKQEEKDEINLQIQNIRNLKLLSLKYILLRKKENQHLKQVFKVTNLHSFLNFILAFNSFFKKLVLQRQL